MLVTFKNTGMIEEANIRFEGLTVIAGENDTGKSTVGKLIFAIVKTFNRYERDASMYRLKEVQSLIDEYYFAFRKRYTERSILEAGKTFFDELTNDALGLIDNSRPIEESRAVIFEKVKSFVETVRRSSDVEVTLEDLPNLIGSLIGSKPSKEEVYKRTLRNYLVSLFSDKIGNKFAKPQEYFINGREGNNTIFEINGTGDSPGVCLHDRLCFEDATFIETPLVANLVDTIRFSKTEFDRNGGSKKQAELLEKAYTPEYMRDLILKLTDHPTRGNPSKIAGHIRDIIGGDFYYDPEERDFVFEKGEQTFKGLSIASGIKYMGIVSILMQAGYLDKKSVLILDEPETHIHPQWQIRFAEVLVELAKEGSTILLTSQSPYFLEAVKLYSDERLEKGRTAFYLSKKIPQRFTSGIGNVTHDISPIFEILAEPFRKLETMHAKDIV